MIPTRDVAPLALSTILRRQPMTDGKMRLAWAAAVGPAVARATSVQLDESGTLRVQAETEHWEREVTRSSGTIQARLGRLLGSGIVKRVRVSRRRRQ